MCHEPTARPPMAPIAGGAGEASSERLVLEASDGNRFNAFSARTISPEAPGIMILPDVRGLHPFYEDLAVRFAQVGVHAAAIDNFDEAGVPNEMVVYDGAPHSFFDRSLRGAP